VATSSVNDVDAPELETHPPRSAAPTVEASDILMRDDSPLDARLAVGTHR